MGGCQCASATQPVEGRGAPLTGTDLFAPLRPVPLVDEVPDDILLLPRDMYDDSPAGRCAAIAIAIAINYGPAPLLEHPPVLLPLYYAPTTGDDVALPVLIEYAAEDLCL